MGGACSTHGEMRNSHKILVGKVDRKRDHLKDLDTYIIIIILKRISR
jgi:hypothetical protein